MGASEEAQALLSGGNPAVSESHNATSGDPKQDAKRSWRFPLWRVVGNGSPEDIVAGCMSIHAPLALLAFGWNAHRTQQATFWRELVKIFVVLFGTWAILFISAQVLFFSCAGWPEPPADGKPMGKQGMGMGPHGMDPHGMDSTRPKLPHGPHHGCHGMLGAIHELPRECRASVVGGFTVIAAIAVTVFIIAVVYAAKRRQQIRQQFGITGTFKQDLLSWLFCAPCALAQETRTLMTNQVHEGVWHGPLVNDPSCAPAPQQMV